MTAEQESCGAATVFWPDVEACDATCILPRGHQPADRHEDEILGEWTEDGMPTHHPDDDDEAERPEYVKVTITVAEENGTRRFFEVMIPKPKGGTVNTQRLVWPFTLPDGQVLTLNADLRLS